MQIAPPHPPDCICEWCAALKRERRQRINTQRLADTLGPEQTFKAKIPPKRKRPYRKCVDCGRIITVRKDGELMRHYKTDLQYCPGSGSVPAHIHKAREFKPPVDPQTLKEFQIWLHSMGGG